MYICKYKTPFSFSDMYLSSDGTYLTDLWFEGSKNDQKHENSYITKELPIFDETKKCLLKQ